MCATTTEKALPCLLSVKESAMCHSPELAC